MAKSETCFVGFDLGGTKMRSVVVDDEFKILSRVKQRSEANESAEQSLERMRACVEESLEEAKVSPERLGGLGFALPGVIDFREGRVVELPNLGWKDVKVRKFFEKIFDAPVAIENDVNAGTFGEFRFGAGKGHEDIVGIFPGTGIGGGIIIGGRIHRGVTGAAGEIGHMIMDPLGRQCGCGSRGCFEAHASRLAIAADVAAFAVRGQAPNIYKKAETDLSGIKSGALAKAIKAGDKAVERVVRDAARMIGFMAVNLIVVLSPSLVVLGGGLVEAMEDLYLEETRRVLKEQGFKSMMDSVKVEAAKLGDDAVNLGAAAIAAEAAESAG